MGSCLQIGSTPCASRCASMNATITCVRGRTPTGRKSRCLAQDLVGLLQLPLLPYQSLEMFTRTLVRPPRNPDQAPLAPPIYVAFQPYTQPYQQSTRALPIVNHVQPDAPIPAEPPVPETPGSTDLIYSSSQEMESPESQGDSMIQLNESLIQDVSCIHEVMFAKTQKVFQRGIIR